MKKFTQFATTLLLLLAMLAISSCEKDGCTDPNAVNYNSKANHDNGTCQYDGTATFTTPDVLPVITVTVSGTAVSSPQQTISQSYAAGTAVCGGAGLANYSLLAGNYTYSATSSAGTWSGSFTIVANQCDLITLGTAPVTFWTNTTQYGTITVTVTGYTPAQITQAYTSGAPSDCASSVGCANFTGVPTGSISYTATGSISGSWNGAIQISAPDQCNLVELQ